MTTKYAYNVDTAAMTSSLKPMERNEKVSAEKFPKHQVQNASILGKSGITMSVEDQSGTKDGLAELEVLKAILNREGYLSRLKQVARTVGKKFKGEVADVLDLVRAASLDVVDMIIRWREIKVHFNLFLAPISFVLKCLLLSKYASQKDHDAAFMWNGINYILKMPSDLDYLADYVAIKRWVGYPLVRNPFCVPYPLEEGKDILTGTTTQHATYSFDAYMYTKII
jgi:hypothetical protein